MLDPRTVALAAAEPPWEYAAAPPFLPDEAYPELQGRVAVGGQRNLAYRLLRSLWGTLGLDLARRGTPDWSPLGDIILPGQTVLVKPNLVRHLHLAGGDYRAVVTHPSLIRAVLDYAAIALRGAGRLVLGDAPVQSADFDAVVARNGLAAICDDVSRAWGLPVELIDFRLVAAETDGAERVRAQNARSGDPAGYRRVDLGADSLLEPVTGPLSRFRVTNYDCGHMALHHGGGIHEYLVPQTVLDADVVLSLPKFKTHRKVCLTAALKNLVGINGHKDWLPHHRAGAASEGGDEYLCPSALKRLQTRLGETIDRVPDSAANPLRRLAIRAAVRLGRAAWQDPYLEGSWHGNDTLWRTVLDLNRLLRYADRTGAMTDRPQRRCLTVVDGIVAGEGEGPMEPAPRPCGILAGGENPVAVDAVLAALAGFDPRRIPLVARGFEIDRWPLAPFALGDVATASADPWLDRLPAERPSGVFRLEPPGGWRGYVEMCHDNLCVEVCTRV